MKLHLDLTDALDAEFPGIEEAHAVAVARESERVVAADGAESREASLSFALSDSAEEGGVGSVDSAQDFLRGREVRQLRSTARRGWL